MMKRAIREKRNSFDFLPLISSGRKDIYAKDIAEIDFPKIAIFKKHDA